MNENDLCSEYPKCGCPHQYECIRKEQQRKQPGWEGTPVPQRWLDDDAVFRIAQRWQLHSAVVRGIEIDINKTINGL